MFKILSGSRPALEIEESKELLKNLFLPANESILQDQRRRIQSERTAICSLRNDYCQIMKEVWDSFERNVKMRVEYELDSDGQIVRDDDGRPNDLSGNDPFKFKSKILIFRSDPFL